MAIAQRAAASNVGNSTTYTVTVPSSVVAGDFMLLALSWGNAASLTATPSGWTQYGSDIVNGAETVRLYTKTAGAGDASSAVQFTASAQSKYALGLVAYSGVTGIGEFHSNIDAGTGTSHITTALSAMSTGGSWALCIWAERSTTNTSWAGPGGLTQRVNAINTGGGANSMLVMDTNATATSLVAETATSGFSTKAVNISLELLATSGVTTPGVPTAVSAVAGDGQATVSFTPGSSGGASSVTYTVTSSPGGRTAQATSSPIVVAGLTNGTSYTFTVTATNTAGTSAASSASAGVTPVAQNALWMGIVPIIGSGSAAPPPNGPPIGVASPTTPTYQDGWDATGGAMKLTLWRVYNGGLPATWAASNGPKVTGPTSYIASFKPDVATTIAGGNDAAITALAKTIPNGSWVTFQHEPEQTAKNITPSDFGAFSLRVYNLVKAANATLKVGIVFMTYTSNDRATGGVHTHGQNEWMAACASAGLTPDWVGFDGYPGVAGVTATTAQGEFSGPAALARGLWPGVDLLCTEFGLTSSPQRSQGIVDAYGYFTNDGWKAFIYFDLVGTQHDYSLTTSEQAVLAGLA